MNASMHAYICNMTAVYKTNQMSSSCRYNMKFDDRIYLVAIETCYVTSNLIIIQHRKQKNNRLV